MKSFKFTALKSGTHQLLFRFQHLSEDLGYKFCISVNNIVRASHLLQNIALAESLMYWERGDFIEIFLLEYPNGTALDIFNHVLGHVNWLSDGEVYHFIEFPTGKVTDSIRPKPIDSTYYLPGFEVPKTEPKPCICDFSHGSRSCTCGAVKAKNL